MRSYHSWSSLGIQGVFFSLVGLSLFSQNSCSLVVDTNAEQCVTDSDCGARGAAFQGFICSPELKTCIKPGGFCRTNSECFDQNNGQPSICRKEESRCFPLKTADCDKIIGKEEDVRNDNVIIFGVSVVTGGTSIARNGKGAERTLSIAVDEFNRAAGGITVEKPAAGGLPAENTVHPVVFLRCNEGGPDPIANLTHLVDTVRVPAIIGPQQSNVTLNAFQTIMGPKKILTLPPTTVTSLVDTLANKKEFLYRFNASDANWAKVQAKIVELAWEPTIRQKNIVTGTNPIKVMYLFGNDAQSASQQSVVDQTLRFNGMAALENGDNYQKRAAGDPTKKDEYPAAQTAAVQAVLAFKPHVILVTGTQETFELTGLVEKAWAGAGVTYRPYWSLSGAITGADFPNLVENNGGEELRKRLLGAFNGPLASSPRTAKLKAKYDALPPDPEAAFSGIAGTTYYDATWTLLLATVATGGQKKPFTSENIAPNIQLLQPPGTEINPDDIASGSMQNGITLLRGSNRVDYDGTSGSCNFDSLSNTRPTMHAFCIGVAPNPPVAGNRVKYAGLNLVEATSDLTEKDGKPVLDVLKTTCAF
jgi:hypothetical protein